MGFRSLAGFRGSLTTLVLITDFGWDFRDSNVYFVSILVVGVSRSESNNWLVEQKLLLISSEKFPDD